MPKIYRTEEQLYLKHNLMKNFVKLVQRVGYTHANIDELVESVGLSKSYFYRLFKSKEDLLLCVLSKQQEQNVKRIHDLMRNNNHDVKVSLQQFLDDIVNSKSPFICSVSDEEAKPIYELLPATVKEQFFNHLFSMQSEIIKLLGLQDTNIDSKVFGNLMINLFMVLGAHDYDSYYYKDALPTTVKLLADTIYDYVIGFI